MSEAYKLYKCDNFSFVRFLECLWFSEVFAVSGGLAIWLLGNGNLRAILCHLLYDNRTIDSFIWVSSKKDKSFFFFGVILKIYCLFYSAKVVYVSGLVFYGVGMVILATFPTKWGVLLLSISAGVIYATLFTLPYLIMANYHASGSVSLFVNTMPHSCVTDSI